MLAQQQSTNLFRLAFGISVTVVAVAIVSAAVYYITTRPRQQVAPSGPTGITPPPPEPEGQTKSMYFFNDRTETIWIIPNIGASSDPHIPRWTDWDPSGGSNTYFVPHTESLAPLKILPGETGTMNIFMAGMASLKFIVRVDCDETTMICAQGDSGFVPFLDGPGLTQSGGQYRGVVPFKPTIDTIIEMTWGCSYTDSSLCAVNPSCIGDPNSCSGMSALMADNPGAKWGKDGLLYGLNGVNIPIPSSASAVALTPTDFFDVSCVDGYTVPIELKVRRPTLALGSAATKCLTNYAPTAPTLDNLADPEWQTLANTSQIKLEFCPTAELLWPTTLRHVTPLIPGGTTDGYNTSIGTQQFGMPWLTQGNSSGTPTSNPPVKLDTRFVPGVTIDLNFYRDPSEIAARPSAGWSINNKIGCASTCSALTSDRSVSMLYPKIGGHQFPTGTYIVPTSSVLSAAERGVADVCCHIPDGTVMAGDIGGQCNTSKYWNGGTGVTGPAVPSDTVANYAFGFYTNVYAPSDSSPWYVNGGPGQPENKNPYSGGSEMSQYVQKIRMGVTGQHQTTRAYAYPVDDVYNTLTCTANSDPATIVSIPNTRGSYHANYDILIIVHRE